MKRILFTAFALVAFAGAALAAGYLPAFDPVSPSIVMPTEAAEAIPWLAVVASAAILAVIATVGEFAQSETAAGRLSR